MLLTGLELEEKSGISRKSINKALKEGKILRPGKKFDTANKKHGIRAYIQAAHTYKYKAANPDFDRDAPLPESWLEVLREDDTPKKSGPKPKIKVSQPPASKPPETEPEPAEERQTPTTTVDGQSQTAVKIKKDLATIRKLDREHDEAMGDLIPRKMVVSLLGNIGSAVTNHIFPLGERLANQVCAVLEITDPEKVLVVKGMIDGEVMPALAEVKREVELRVLDNGK